PLLLLTLSVHCSAAPPDLHSFPTRRSSDLTPQPVRYSQQSLHCGLIPLVQHRLKMIGQFLLALGGERTMTFGKSQNGALFRHCQDRKSTRLNSSHVKISYAVFCLKKKRKPS